MNFEKFNVLISTLHVHVLCPLGLKPLTADQRMIAVRALYPAAKGVPGGAPGKEVEM
jgi:hypothetical protein